MSGRLVRDDVNGKGHLRVSRQERTVLRQSPWCRNVVVVPCAPAKILKPRPFPVKIASARERCTISLDVDQPKISMQAKKLML